MRHAGMRDVVLSILMRSRRGGPVWFVIPFDSQGRLAPILKRQRNWEVDAFVFDSLDGEF
jgi:hypothetical protein